MAYRNAAARLIDRLSDPRHTYYPTALEVQRAWPGATLEQRRVLARLCGGFASKLAGGIEELARILA